LNKGEKKVDFHEMEDSDLDSEHERELAVRRESERKGEEEGTCG